MGKKKLRKNRWTYREELKEDSNRHNNLKAQHPQVRRQIQPERYETHPGSIKQSK